MNKLVIATNNQHKIEEIQQLLGDQYDFLSLQDIGCLIDIPETSPTIPGNALQKARYVYENYGKNCFAEDTGLEIDALDGAPGVITARYAGPQRDPQANMTKALKALEGKENRGAQFRTVVALIIDGTEYTFEGIVRGQIAEKRMDGDFGFGYDPIFVPDGHHISFAQMPQADKGAISHRGRAIAKLQAFLQDL